MKLTEPITVDLLQFFKTGKFDCLKLGQTKEWISSNFPDPDIVYRNNYESPIWFYGRIELHFHDDDSLFLIYSDHIDTLTAGENIILNKWILEDVERLSLLYVIEHLNEERIDFKLKHHSDSQGFVSIGIELLNSKVILGFAPEDSGFELTSFSLSNHGLV